MKMMLKWSQKDRWNDPKFWKICKKGIWKSMRKFDAEKWCRRMKERSTLAPPGLHFWTGRGGRGGKISDYTGYFGRLLILSTRSPPRRGAADEQWSKMEPGGAQDRFILRFYRFLEKAKKLDFSMRFWGDRKTRKIDPWSAKGSKKAPRPTTGGRLSRQGGHGPRV